MPPTGLTPSPPPNPESGRPDSVNRTLAAATVDRLLHHAHVIVTEGTESYRLAQATDGKGVVPLD